MDLENWVTWKPMEQQRAGETVIPKPRPPSRSQCKNVLNINEMAKEMQMDTPTSETMMVPQPGPLIPTYPMGYCFDNTKLQSLNKLQ